MIQNLRPRFPRPAIHRGESLKNTEQQKGRTPMHRGELLVRSVGKDEAYWVVMVAAVVAVATLGRGHVPQDVLTLAGLALICAMAAARFTLFKTLDVQRLDWSMDEHTLTIGSDVIPLEDVFSVGVHSGLNAKGSRTLVIKTKARGYRYPAVTLGTAHRESVRALWEIHDLLQADLQARKAQ